jgi:hypothetical protein
MAIEIARIIFALFQMAILSPTSLSAMLRKDDHNACETYIRSTINSEEAA